MKVEHNVIDLKYKISFCTVCMNRLEHLKKTLPINIKENLSYGSVEFIVVDYNSKDGLESWIKTEMKEYIDSGILVYTKLDWPKYFLRSHSKNIASKKATGDIVCNVDADNFIGKGFADYVNKQFLDNPQCYLAVDKNSGKKDFFGRICLYKKDFMSLHGYDENMTNYGFEDFDLQNRLNILGRHPIFISNDKYLKALDHNDEMRIENEQNFNELAYLYIRYINYYSSELLYFFSDGSFYKGIVLINKLINSTSPENIFNYREFEYSHNLENNSWEFGTWNMADGILKLISSGKEVKLIKKLGTDLSLKLEDESLEYNRCTERKLIKELILFFSEINNRIKMMSNKSNNVIRVNDTFGEVTPI